MASAATTIMDLASQEMTQTKIRKEGKQRKRLVPKVQLKVIVNKAVKAQKVQVMKYHQHQANRAGLRIMMMERRKPRPLNNQRNLKIE